MATMYQALFHYSRLGNDEQDKVPFLIGTTISIRNAGTKQKYL